MRSAPNQSTAGATSIGGRVYTPATMIRDVIATAANTEIQLQIRQLGPSTFVATIDGVEHPVDARRLREGGWSLLIAGRSYVVDLDGRAGTGAARMVRAGQTDALVTVEDAAAKRLAAQVRRGRGAGQSGETVKAPIAGKVVKYLVAEGEVVAQGQGVVVLEAMKMENELRAERGGTVVKIFKAAGQPVETHDKLLTLT